MALKGVKHDTTIKQATGVERLLTKEGLAKITELAGEGLTTVGIAKSFGVTAMTFWRWRKDHPEIDDAIIKGIPLSVEKVEDALFKNATMPTPKFPYGNITAQIFFLCNRAPDRWKSAMKNEVSGNISTGITYYKDLTDEQLTALANAEIDKKDGDQH
jgi:hypothetical protein